MEKQGTEVDWLGIPKPIDDSHGVEVERYLIAMVAAEITRLVEEKMKRGR